MLMPLPLPGPNPAALRFQHQLDLIERQAETRGPYKPVTLSAADATAWFAGPGASDLPTGVSDLHLAATPNSVTGSAEVDFAKLPVHSMFFTGRHDVSAQAHFDGAYNGAAHFTLTTVALDGTAIPNFLVELAIRTFIQPKHPEIGTSFAVQLPAHVRGAMLGNGWARLEY